MEYNDPYIAPREDPLPVPISEENKLPDIIMPNPEQKGSLQKPSWMMEFVDKIDNFEPDEIDLVDKVDLFYPCVPIT